MRTQFIFNENDKTKREEFYDYIVNKYNFKKGYPYKREEFINSIYPFVVDFKTNSF